MLSVVYFRGNKGSVQSGTFYSEVVRSHVLQIWIKTWRKLLYGHINEKYHLTLILKKTVTVLIFFCKFWSVNILKFNRHLKFNHHWSKAIFLQKPIRVYSESTLGNSQNIKIPKVFLAQSRRDFWNLSD